MTDEELSAISIEVMAEQGRRHALTSIPQQMAALNEGYLDAAGTEQGEAWVQPAGAHDAYPVDWVVTHKDTTWVSLMAANVWEPGVSGWREQVEVGYPDWVQPTGAHDVYNAGDQVHYVPDGKNYESVIDNNSWSPTDYPAGWTEIP